LEGEPQYKERLLPLNSKLLTSTYLRRIAEALELPTGGSPEETRQMIEGKLSEREEGEGGVQVLVREAACLETRLLLRDAKCILLETVPIVKPLKGYEADESKYRELREELRCAHEQVAADRARATEDVATELYELRASLEAEKEMQAAGVI